MTPVIACNLTAIPATERPRYQLLIEKLRAAVRGRSNRTNGYAYTLAGACIDLPEVAEWMSMERRCCPFFTFRLTATGTEDDWVLTLTGPSGVKALLNREIG